MVTLNRLIHGSGRVIPRMLGGRLRIKSLRLEKKAFTLVELLAVMAIIGILAGVGAGAVTGLTPRGQNAQIESDTKVMETAADRFLSESFPQIYPVSDADTNSDGDLDEDDSPPLPAGAPAGGARNADPSTPDSNGPAGAGHGAVRRSAGPATMRPSCARS